VLLSAAACSKFIARVMAMPPFHAPSTAAAPRLMLMMQQQQQQPLPPNARRRYRPIGMASNPWVSLFRTCVMAMCLLCHLYAEHAQAASQRHSSTRMKY
jgi:hypothetical protein